ncbi:MAG: TldD/PmbA family protein, partial [Thermoleophilaceae bacterium]
MTLIGPDLAARVLDRALTHGGDFGEVYAEDRYGFALGLDDSKLERPQTGRERGACVRVVQGDSTFFGHVDGLSEADIMRVAESVSQAVRAGDPTKPAALSAVEPRDVHPISEPPEEVEAARKAEMLRACDERARSEGGEVAQVMASYAENRRIVEVFNSSGLAAADDRTRVRLGVQVVARRNGRVETGNETLGGHIGFEILEEDPAAVAERAARKAVVALDAVDAPSGRMPVVVGNAFGGVLL